jgi:hypothetical protein
MSEGEGAKIGLAAAVQALRPGPAPAAAGEQMMLAGLPLGEVGRGPGPTPGTAEPSVGKGGRPAGARNRRTQEWVDFIGARYRSPLVVLAEIYSRPVEDLAKALGCKKLEAFQLQLEAAKQLAPYLHQKLPLAVEFEGKNLIALTLQAAPELLRLAGVEVEDEGLERVVEAKLIND